MRQQPRAGLRTFEIEALEERLVLDASAITDTAAYEAWRNTTFTIGDINVVSAPQVSVQQYSDGSLLRQARLAISPAPIYVTPPASAYDAQAWSLIGASTVSTNYNFKGAGYSVAVIDTGIDPNITSLAGRILPGWNFVANNSNTADDNGHGTFVATEIASNNVTYPGIVPQANVIPLKVLDASGSGSFGYVQDALAWVVAHRAQYNIVAVNMSLGAGNYSTNPFTFLDSNLSALKSQGVFISVASGNSFYPNNSTPGLAFPSIDSLVVSVGAVYDASVGRVSWSSGAVDYSTGADRVASFTQRSAKLNILAPGAMITGIGRGNSTITMAGTSMAAPVVAGAAVLLHQVFDAYNDPGAANQDNILNVMRSTGVNVVDGDDENDNVVNTGLTFKRLNLLAAVQYVVNAYTQPAPTPTPTPTPTTPPAPNPSYPVQPGSISSAAELVAVFNAPNWSLYAYDPNTGTTQKVTINFGGAGDKPVVGSWNGSGYDSFGVYRNGTWYLDFNGTGVWDGGDRTFGFGIAGDTPVAGDWNADGRAEIGVFRNGMWYLDVNGSTRWDFGDRSIQFGIAGDTPVVGDWNGDGREKIGVFRNGTWYLDWNGNGGWDNGDRIVGYGTAGDLTMVADFQGDGQKEIAVLRGNTWYVDANRSFGWNGASIDKIVTGTSSDFSSSQVLIAGRWNPAWLDGRFTLGSASDGVANVVPASSGLDVASINQGLGLAATGASSANTRSGILDDVFSSFSSSESFHLNDSIEDIAPQQASYERSREATANRGTDPQDPSNANGEEADQNNEESSLEAIIDEDLWALV
jgi:hypothetical protein